MAKDVEGMITVTRENDEGLRVCVCVGAGAVGASRRYDWCATATRGRHWMVGLGECVSSWLIPADERSAA